MHAVLPPLNDVALRGDQELGQPAGSRPINVCFVIDELRTGGTETQLLRMIASFDSRRVRPHLCLLDGTSEASRRLEPITCPVIRLGVRKLLSATAIRQARRFCRTLKSWKIDLVQVHFPDSTYFGVAAAKWAGAPCIVRTRRDLFYWVTPVQRRWGRLLDQCYNRWWVDAMVVNSAAVKEAALDQERPAPARIEIIPNGLDVAAYRRTDSSDPPRRSPRIGMLAMLRPEKRVDVFIEAARLVAARRPDVTFHIAGDGPERSRAEALIHQAALTQQVQLLGPIADVPGFLADLDVAVLCSDTEGLSNAILEYMAAGLPIVATAVGGNLELLEHRRTAWLVPPGDAAALADAVVEILGDADLRQRLGLSAQRVVAAEFDVRAVAGRFQDLYADLVRAAARRGRRSPRL